VYESGMIITQMETNKRSQMVAVNGTPCAIPPRNSNIILPLFNNDVSISEVAWRRKVIINAY
jgi:hypothetical protein